MHMVLIMLDITKRNSAFLHRANGALIRAIL